MILDINQNNGHYENGLEQICDFIKLLDIKIRITLDKQQLSKDGDYLRQFKGLVVRYEDLFELFNQPSEEFVDCQKAQGYEEQINRLESSVRERSDLSKKNGVFLPLSHLFEVFDLNWFEQQCVIICLAAEMDRKYEKVYGFLQDDITIKHPTAALVLHLLCRNRHENITMRRYLDDGGKLARYFFLPDSAADGKISGLSKELKLDPRIVRFLLQDEGSDSRLKGFTDFYAPEPELPPLLFGREIQQKLHRFISLQDWGVEKVKESIIFYLWGPPGSGKTFQVRHWCRSANKRLIVIDLQRLDPENASFHRLLTCITREALIQNAVICFRSVDLLFEERNEVREGDYHSLSRRLSFFLNELLAMADWHPGIYFWIAEHPWRQKRDQAAIKLIEMEFMLPDDNERKQYWEIFASGYSLAEPVDWGAMGSKFRFTPGQIRNVLSTAEKMAGWHFGEDGGIHAAELFQACYAEGHSNLSRKAVRIKPQYQWEALILPAEPKDQLKNACNQMKYRHIVFGQWGFDRKLSYGKGLSILFSGPPGTGKTMAAQVFAKELDLEIYKIDISQLVSKYIGETEKNINEVFAGAQLSNVILFFDEADAMFGKRSEVKDSHDRYSNIETAYLLQKIEEYEGVSILATNFIKNIDDAFMRRFNFVIEFPFPDAYYREKIWRAIFPKETPLDPDMDFKFIADKLEISGGNIKNIALAAAFLAAEGQEPVGIKHIIRAAKYEIHKTGKIFSHESLAEYYEG